MTAETSFLIPDLYHYTCRCRAGQIERSGVLLAAARMLDRNKTRTLLEAMPTLKYSLQMVWCTTLPDVTAVTQESCGLTSYMGDCDRSEYRFQVLPGQQIVPWTVLRERWPLDAVAELESAPGCRPGTWWVSAGPVFVQPSHRLLPVA